MSTINFENIDLGDWLSKLKFSEPILEDALNLHSYDFENHPVVVRLRQDSEVGKWVDSRIKLMKNKEYLETFMKLDPISKLIVASLSSIKNGEESDEEG